MSHDFSDRHGDDGVVSITEADNPYSLVNLVPDVMREEIAKLPEELLSMGERKLKALARPGETDYGLRMNFWHEFNRTMADPGPKSRISAFRVYSGVCSKKYFDTLCRNERKLAWFIRPMKSHQRTLDDLLRLGYERMYEIVQAPIYKTKKDRHGREMYDKDGRLVKELDSAMAKVVLSAVQHVENRAKGMAIQRKITKTENVSMKVGLPDTPKELAKHIEALEREVKKEVVDVEPDDGSGEDTD